MGTILVTGHNGFIASHIIEELNKHKMQYQLFNGDCISYESWEKNLAGSDFKNITHLLHCAGHNGGIKYNCEFPATVFYKNTIMGLNAIKACSAFKIPYFITFVTSCGYPDHERIGELDNTPYHEYEYLQGKPNETIECHGYAKRNMILACKYYFEQAGVLPMIFCPNTVFGPRDRTDDRAKVMMALIKKFIFAKLNHDPTIVLFGDGSPLREFTYVKHVSQIVREWISNPTYFCTNGEPFNIGPSFELSIHDLAYKISEKVGYKGTIIWDMNHPNGAMRKALNYDKQRYYELYPQKVFTLDEGINETIKWYTEILQEKDIGIKYAM